MVSNGHNAELEVQFRVALTRVDREHPSTDRCAVCERVLSLVLGANNKGNVCDGEHCETLEKIIRAGLAKR